LGVDDVYIILLALKKQKGYTLDHWLNAMEEIVVPVTMTSLVNASVSARMVVSTNVIIYFLCITQKKTASSISIIRCLPF
jgi:hypothetical protein